MPKNKRGVVDVVSEFKPGDTPPSAYLAWHEWARVQTKAGLKQRRCWGCGLLRFPQEKCCGPQRASAATPEQAKEGMQDVR